MGYGTKKVTALFLRPYQIQDDPWMYALKTFCAFTLRETTLSVSHNYNKYFYLYKKLYRTYNLPILFIQGIIIMLSLHKSIIPLVALFTASLYSSYPLTDTPIEIINHGIIPNLPLKAQAALTNSCKYLANTVVFYAKTLSLLNEKPCQNAITERDLWKYICVMKCMHHNKIQINKIDIKYTPNKDIALLLNRIKNCTPQALTLLYHQQDSYYTQSTFSTLPPYAALEAIPTLTLLRLIKIPIEADSFSTFIYNNHTITDLCIRDTRLPAKDTTKILSAIATTKIIKNLSLAGNSISKEGLDSLHNNTTLELLDLNNCFLGNNTANSLIDCIETSSELKKIYIYDCNQEILDNYMAIQHAGLKKNIHIF